MRLEVKAGLADGPIPALTLSLLDYLDGGMNPDPKDMQRRKQCVQLLGPTAFFADVLDDQAIPRLGEREMEPVEEPGPLIMPASRTSLFSCRPKTRVRKLIRCVLTKWLIKRSTQCRGKRRLSGT